MRATALLATLGALALAGPAHAAERVARFPANGLYPVAGPVPIGGEVAYGYRFGAGRWWLGTTTGTLAVLAAYNGARRADVLLAASPVRACPRGCRGSVSIALRDAPGRALTRKRVAFRASPRARVVRLPLDARDARALRKAAPPVLIQRFSGRDGTGEPAVVRRQRYVRHA